jgi:uncharacterized protein (UPF0276 family)
VTQVTGSGGLSGPEGKAGAPPLTGVGLGLRWTFLEEALTAELPPQLAFFELSPENYMRRGGYYPEALRRMQLRRPLRSHGLMLDVGGCEPFDEDYLGQLRSFLDAFAFDTHSDHLCWSRSANTYLHELLPLAWSRAEALRIAGRIRELQDRLARPLSVENVSAYAAICGPHEPERGAAFLRTILEEAECGLLLDVNNVAVNGENFGFDPWDYISRLPLERVTSMHIGGGQRLPHFGDRVIDTHGSCVSLEVSGLMARVLAITGPLPVLYERDNEIPSFAELLAEVVELDGIYQEALAADAELPQGTTPAPPPVELPEHSDFDQSAMRAYMLAPEGDQPHPGMSDEHAMLYRRLVRGALAQPIESFLERSAARLGARFDDFVSEWLAAGASSSPYLRDLPQDFVDWAAPRIEADPTLPAWTVDLMRHEVVHYRVGGAAAPAPSPGGGLTLDKSLHFALPFECLDYSHAVHELPLGVEDRSEAPERAVSLMVYRDARHIVRYLELSPFAVEMVERLHEGQSVEQALRAQLEVLSGTLPDEELARAGQVLAQLAERGIID